MTVLAEGTKRWPRELTRNSDPPGASGAAPDVAHALEEESALIARCRTGDAAAWDDLFTRHYAATGRFLFQLGYPLVREDVEELCQEVFLTVIRRLNGFRGGCRLQTWIFQVALNKARDFCQRRQAEKRGGGRSPLPLEGEPETIAHVQRVPSPAAAPDVELVRREEWVQVGDALNQLRAPYREILALRYFGELSYLEIAAALRLNPRTVSARLSRSLRQLERVWETLQAKRA